MSHLARRGAFGKQLKKQQNWRSARLCCALACPANFAWERAQKPLRFVQRGRILLRCGSASALPLPSLGVSSLDLGRLLIASGPFFLPEKLNDRYPRSQTK